MMAAAGSSDPSEPRSGLGAKALGDLARRAAEGDSQALDAVVRALQDPIYNVALRMLWHPQDAEDATQEILVKIVTNLGSFRGEAALATWAYRVATNHLLTTRKRRAEKEELGFDEFGSQLEKGLSDDMPPGFSEQELDVLTEEVKIGCSQAMLLCLDREHRAAYVLGEILGLSGRVGAEILEIGRAAFRKRLSRARTRVEGFVRRHCGLADPDNPCRCPRRLPRAVELGRVDPERLLFAGTAARDGGRAEQAMWEVEELRSAAAVLRSNPDYRVGDDFVEGLRSLLEARSDLMDRDDN